MQVCSGPALTLFTDDELELATCGTPHLNFEDLESVARYEGGYNQQHPTVKNLWSVLHDFSLEEKQAFLKFTTGCYRYASCNALHCMVQLLAKLGSHPRPWTLRASAWLLGYCLSQFLSNMSDGRSVHRIFK